MNSWINITKYKFSLVCLLSFPSILYGMEVEHEAGTPMSDFGKSTVQLGGVLSNNIVEKVSALIAELNASKKRNLLEQMDEIAKERGTIKAEDTYLLGELLHTTLTSKEKLQKTDLCLHRCSTFSLILFSVGIGIQIVGKIAFFSNLY